MNEETGLQRQEYGIQQLEKMGEYIAKSGLFGMKTKDQAIALMLVAQAEGLHPATAAQDYHIIQGRPSLKADAMLARFQRAGGAVKYHKYTDEEVSATFSHPQGGSLDISWDMARAKKAGLGTKDNWKNYPRNMLRARVISEGIRSLAPGVLGGMYTPEEVVDMTPASTAPKQLPEQAPEDVRVQFCQFIESQGAPLEEADEYLKTVFNGDDTEAKMSRALKNQDGFMQQFTVWMDNLEK